MKTIDRQNRETYSFTGFFLLAGICHLLERSSVTWLNSLMFSLNFTIYVGLLLFWMQSVRVRLLPTRARAYILSAAFFMQLLLLFRMMRYRVFVDGFLGRYLWYAYYISILVMPTLFLMASIRFDTQRKRVYDERLLLIPAVVIALGVLSNDAHHLTFAPRPGVPFPTGAPNTYSYGPLLYLIYVWIGLCVVGGIVYLIQALGKTHSMRKALVPLAFLLLWPVINLAIRTAKTYDLRRPYEVAEVAAFCMVGVFEACIRYRLIPYNENHIGFFERLTLPVMITDRFFAPVYHSALPIQAGEGEARRALDAPVYLSEDIKLSGMALTAGYAFWTEDEGELHKENRRLESANELLSEENDLIGVENQLKEKKARLDAEAKVYAQIAAAIYPKQRKIETLLSHTGAEEVDFSATLARVCVLNAYSKRKSNLLLLSEDTLPKENRELFLALQESARFLSGCGVEAAAVGEEYADFPLPLVHALYDAFETVIEAWLPFLRRMTVSLTKGGVRMAMETRGRPALPETPLPVERKESDDIIFLTIRAQKGGDAL